MIQPHATDALLVIDMQRDFLPGGPLGVAGGDALIAPIEALARRFDHVILTADWHPSGHISFASAHPGKTSFTDTLETAYGTQMLWPDHCLQGQAGAEIAVDIPHAELVLRKGFRHDIDSYSAFLENDHVTPTGLAGYLRERQITRLFFCGLAYDFCVGSSAVDGSKLAFECLVIDDLSLAVGLPGTVDAIHRRLDAAKVRRIRTADLQAAR